MKKKGNGEFDVTMRSYDGVVTCELVGLFLLNGITNERKILTIVGLYRDDGLGVIENAKVER